MISLISAIVWLQVSIDKAVSIFAAVLIVACPCAFALAIPFTYGNTLRIFGKNKFYLKNTAVIEKLARTDTIVFDKTGTITQAGESRLEFIGDALNEFEQSLVKSLTRNSTHVLSKRIYDSLPSSETLQAVNFKEYTGKGIEGEILGNKILLGSDRFLENSIYNIPGKETFSASSKVYLSINGKVKGYFEIKNNFRQGLKDLISKLKNKFTLYLLSGDNDREKASIEEYFGSNKNMYFRQSPEDKLDFVETLQRANKNVLMVGDGLNDAGALKQSNTVITISDTITNFSPACDAILDSQSFEKMYDLISFSKYNIFVIKLSYAVSFLYNLIGLGFAMRGHLSPLVAAILMPVSSISVVLLVIGLTNRKAKKMQIKK